MNKITFIIIISNLSDIHQMIKLQFELDTYFPAHRSMAKLVINIEIDC